MKAIYQPKGAAGEYAKYACNFYVGCSNQCSYCYNRKGLVRNRLGGGKPTLCKKFKSESDALTKFFDDINEHVEELKACGGVFLSFTTDPCLPETIDLTRRATECATHLQIPITILTKSTSIILDFPWMSLPEFMYIGFTLTHSDISEGRSSPHCSRLMAIKRLVSEGYNVWASIEPVITIRDAEIAIMDAVKVGCRDFKIGLLTGEKKPYTPAEVQRFYDRMNRYFEKFAPGAKVYWKHSVMKYIRMV